MLQHPPGPNVVCSDEVRDRIHIVTAPSGKRNLPKVQIVGNPEVRDRRQAVLIDGIPEAELSGYPSIEPLQYRMASAARRRGDKNEKFARLPMLDELDIVRVRSV